MIIEIRTYRLKPGTRHEFVHLMETVSVPMLEERGITVVDWGPSLVDEGDVEEAYLIRAFASVEEHHQQESDFYGSEEWRNGPRDTILSLIESYHTIVFEATPEAVAALRR